MSSDSGYPLSLSGSWRAASPSSPRSFSQAGTNPSSPHHPTPVAELLAQDDSGPQSGIGLGFGTSSGSHTPAVSSPAVGRGGVMSHSSSQHHLSSMTTRSLEETHNFTSGNFCRYPLSRFF